MGFITDIWNVLFFKPMLNGLLLLDAYVLHNFGITIIVFTIIIRLVTLPLTLKQLQSAKAMAALQPKIKELQNKYGKDRERLSQETMALYKEYGVNPVGCAVPTLIQFPIWIGLYQSITFALGDKPEGLVALSENLYAALEAITHAFPLENRFLWLNMANPDTTYILPVLVTISTWLQQKMMTTPSTDPQQKQMNSMMQTMMPLLFGFMTLQFASGLAIYWIASNLIGVVIQYFVTGWGGLAGFAGIIPQKETAAPTRGNAPSRKEDGPPKRPAPKPARKRK